MTLARTHHIQILFVLTQSKDVYICNEKIQLTYSRTRIRLTDRNELFHILKRGGKNLSRITYSAKVSFVFENERKYFHGKQKLNDIASVRSSLQMILEGALKTEKK